MRLRQGPDGRRLWLIAYDVSDDRRRTRVARVLEAHGERLQKSVFEARLNRREVRGVVEALEPLVNRHEDRVDFIPICRTDEGGRRSLGQRRARDTGQPWEVW